MWRGNSQLTEHSKQKVATATAFRYWILRTPSVILYAPMFQSQQGNFTSYSTHYPLTSLQPPCNSFLHATSTFQSILCHWQSKLEINDDVVRCNSKTALEQLIKKHQATESLCSDKQWSKPFSVRLCLSHYVSLTTRNVWEPPQRASFHFSDTSGGNWTDHLNHASEWTTLLICLLCGRHTLSEPITSANN